MQWSVSNTARTLWNMLIPEPPILSVPGKTVLWIVSQWYSGSSILNLLLDQQSGVRGLGECYHLYGEKVDSFCSCGRSLKNCAFFREVRLQGPDDFYSRCFAAYGCAVLVDASKTWEHFSISYDPTIPTRAVVLSKTPHEWLISRLRHHPTEASDPILRFREYIAFYRHNLQRLQQAGIAVQTLSYRDLASHPYTSLQGILHPLGLTVAKSSMVGPWSTDTHIAGGNDAVFHQLRDNRAFFSKQDRHSGRFGKIVVDAPPSQQEDRQRWIEAYVGCRDELDPLLLRLGQPSVVEFIEELSAPRMTLFSFLNTKSIQMRVS